MRKLFLAITISMLTASAAWSDEATCKAAAQESLNTKRNECRALPDAKEMRKCMREAGQANAAAQKACEPPIIADKKSNVKLESANGKFIVNVPKGSNSFEGRADSMYGSFLRFKVPLTGKDAKAKAKEIAKLLTFFAAKKIEAQQFKPDGNGGYDAKKITKRSFAIKKFSASLGEDGRAMYSGTVREKIKTAEGTTEVGAVVSIFVGGSVTDGKVAVAEDATEVEISVSTMLPEQ